MKKHCILLFIVFFSLNTSVFAQDFWEILQFPDSVIISSLAVNTQGSIFVSTRTEQVVDGVYRSQNGGETWELVYHFFQTAGGNSIAINEEGAIYIVTNQGLNNLLISYDNGNTWTSKSLPLYNGGAAVKIVTGGIDTLYVSKWDWGATLIRSVDDGNTWELLFESPGYGDEYVTDILQTVGGALIIALKGYDLETGGVFMSSDDGNTWELIALPSHQIMDIEFDTSGNLLIADRSDLVNGMGGIYRYDFINQQTDTLLYGPSICGILNVTENEIFASAPFGVLFSNNGLNFNYLNSGIPFQSQMGELHLDSQQYIYSIFFTGSNYIFKSTDAVAIKRKINIANHFFNIFPNPCCAESNFCFTLERECNVELLLSDMSGREIKKVIPGVKPAGTHTFQWNLRPIASGMYVYSLILDGKLADVKKMSVTN
jgi:hypothetical protein